MSSIERESAHKDDNHNGYVLASTDYIKESFNTFNSSECSELALTNNQITELYDGLCQQYPLQQMSKNFVEEKETISSFAVANILIFPYYLIFLYFSLNSHVTLSEKRFTSVMILLSGQLLSIIVSLMIKESYSLSFKWVNRWVSKWKKYQSLPSMTSQYEKALKQLDNEDFQHQYMVHVQMHYKHYSAIRRELVQKLGGEDALIKTIDSNLANLQEYQSSLIDNFTWKKSYANVNIIKQIENTLQTLKTSVSEKTTYVQEKESFLNRYQIFLQKNNLEYTQYQETPESEAQRNLDNGLKKSL